MQSVPNFKMAVKKLWENFFCLAHHNVAMYNSVFHRIQKKKIGCQQNFFVSHLRCYIMPMLHVPLLFHQIKFISDVTANMKIVWNQRTETNN